MFAVKNAFYSCVLLIGTVLALYGTPSISVQSKRTYLAPSKEETVAYLLEEQRTRKGPGPTLGGYTEAVVLSETGGRVSQSIL